MASKLKRPRSVALVGIRAALIGVLASLVLYLLGTTSFYGIAIVVLIAVALVVADLAGPVFQAHQSLEHFLAGLEDFLEDLRSGAAEVRVRGSRGFERITDSMRKTAFALDKARTTREAQMIYLQTLLDAVTPALIVLNTDGKITLANQAARSLVLKPADRLQDIATIGAPAAQLLSSLSPGAREIVQFADGQQILASVVQITLPDGTKRRLIALQRIAEDFWPTTR